MSAYNTNKTEQLWNIFMDAGIEESKAKDYVSKFIAEDVKDIKILEKLTDEQLKQLGLTMGNRVKLKQYLSNKEKKDILEHLLDSIQRAINIKGRKWEKNYSCK